MLEFGVEKMRQSVERLKAIREKIEAVCLVKDFDGKSVGKNFTSWNKDIEAVKVNEEIRECVLMGLKEKSLIDIIRSKQE